MGIAVLVKESDKKRKSLSQIMQRVSLERLIYVLSPSWEGKMWGLMGLLSQ